MKCTKIEMMNKAIKLFQKNGFEATSVNQICEACNVTKGSFYNYYKSKTDILLDFYNVLLSNFSLSFADLIGIESYREQLWQVITYSIDATIKLGPDLLCNMMIADMKAGGAQFNASLERLQETAPGYHKLIYTLIQKTQEKEEIRSKSSPEQLWYAYTNGLLGIAMNWSASGGEYDEKEALRTLFDIIFEKN